MSKKVLLLSAVIIIGILLMTILYCSGIVGSRKTHQKVIDEIYFYHSVFGQRYPEYKIDLKNKKLWKYTISENYVPRDTSAENEGYWFVCDLDDKDISVFLKESARYGLTKWKQAYIEKNILDGHQWGMVVLFSDSTSMTVEGSNKYPKTWNEMRDVFLDLTGEDILIGLSR